MKLFRFVTPGLLAISSLAWAVTPEDGQIKAVENGLLPVNVFKGDKPWTLQERMQHFLAATTAGMAQAGSCRCTTRWFGSYW